MEAEKQEYKKGLWTEVEDRLLLEYVRVHGRGLWNRIPKLTGLKRCGKSCRLRWLNYLSPNVKRGGFSEQEDDLIIRLHNLLGNRWSLIAGRVPGRTDNQVKNHWNTHLCKNKKAIRNPTSSAKRRRQSSSSSAAPATSCSPGDVLVTSSRNINGSADNSIVNGADLGTTEVVLGKTSDHDLGNGAAAVDEEEVELMGNCLQSLFSNATSDDYYYYLNLNFGSVP